ncbi:MAG: redoxin domain-containing protein [Candidatus Omnitrophica bacterium]|nr:redoxin domain-containing protein [Candidatus Omnitrophota bacterium]
MAGLAGLAFLLCAAAPAADSPDPESFGGPQEGDEVPDLTLKDLDGRPVRLADFKKKKPVLLVTGSYSCPVYRQRLSALKKLHERHGRRAAIFVLYTVEAHPVGEASPYAPGEWLTEENRREGLLLKQPRTYEGRAALASRCQTDLKSPVPVLVDGMDNAAWETFGRAPNAAYLVDYAGKIHLRQGWFEPVAMEEALLALLSEEPPKW